MEMYFNRLKEPNTSDISATEPFLNCVYADYWRCIGNLKRGEVAWIRMLCVSLKDEIANNKRTENE
jgi:hypothetical protein